MSMSTAPQLSISLDFAEELVQHLQEAAGLVDKEFLLRDAERLQAAIDVQFSQTPPQH